MSTTTIGTSTTVTITANTSQGTVTINPPSPVDIKNVANVEFELEANGTDAADVEAFLVVSNIGSLVPNAATAGTAFNGVVFPLEVGPGAFTPTFGKSGATTGVGVAVTVVFPAGTVSSNQPVQSVIIIDW